MLTLICAFSFGAIVRIAVADYHTTCVNHGDQPLSRQRAARTVVSGQATADCATGSA